MKISWLMTQVKQFMRGAGQTIREVPTVPTQQELRARCALQLEEALEFCQACGYDINYLTLDSDESCPVDAREVSNMLLDHIESSMDGDTPIEPDIVAIIDAAADSIVIATGTFVACGVKDIPVLNEVMENNLQKIAKGRLVDGKFVKPEGHQPPDINQLIIKMKNGEL